MESPNQENTTAKKFNFKSIIGLIIGFLAVWGIQQYLKPSIDKQLMDAASEMNKTCPIIVDQETRLDNSVALPGKLFQYNYTLVNTEVGQVDTIKIRDYIRPLATSNIKTNPDMKFQRENKVTLRYNYRDKNGNYLFAFDVSPDMYQN